jgi:hypothetical protein
VASWQGKKPALGSWNILPFRIQQPLIFGQQLRKVSGIEMHGDNVPSQITRRRGLLKDSTMMWLWAVLAFLIPGAIIVGYIILDTLKVLPSFVRGAANPITLMSISGFCAFYARRYHARLTKDRVEIAGASVAQLVMAEDRRAPVLYLRSFKEDIKAGKPRNVHGETQEEMLKSVFSQAGPFVALGKPNESFPTLGADRLYLDQDWENTVVELMLRCRFVVVRTGATESLNRELLWATQQLRPEQLVLVVPSGKKHYESFRSTVQRYFPNDLPTYPSWKTPRAGIKGLICFDSDWIPRFLSFKRMFVRGSMLNPLPRSLQSLVRPVYERLNIPWRPPSVNWIRVLIIGLSTLLLLFVGYKLVD